MEHRYCNNSAIQEYMQLLGNDQTQFSTLARFEYVYFAFLQLDPYALLLLVSLVLLAIIIILLSVWYIRYSRSKASRDGNNSRTIIGTVGGFQSHTKQTLNTGRNKIIWTFRIERFD